MVMRRGRVERVLDTLLSPRVLMIEDAFSLDDVDREVRHEGGAADD